MANHECTLASSRSRARVLARNDRRHDISLDMGSPCANMAHAKACNEVERLHALISLALAAIDATVQIKPRARSQKGKASGNDLIKKITKVASMLKKKTE